MLEVELIDASLKCPRCHYDQSGVLSTWRESCPMSGRCSECGLAFEWYELLSRTMAKPRWCVEFEDRKRVFLVRVSQTLAMSFWPPRFFSSLKMGLEPRWGRIVAYLFILATFLYLVFAVRQGAYAYVEWRRLERGISFVMPMPALNVDGSLGTFVTPNSPVTTYRTDVSPFGAVLQAVIWPRSDQPPGNLTGAPGQVPPPGAMSWVSRRRPVSIPHTPPRDVLHRHLPPDRLSMLSTLCLWQGLAIVFCVGFFAFLPISRRRAKVRWAHLVRIGAYSLALLFLPPLAVLLGAFVIGVLLALFTPILLFVWWWQATARYLRMPHAFAVALAAVVMAALAAALAPVLVRVALGAGPALL